MLTPLLVPNGSQESLLEKQQLPLPSPRSPIRFPRRRYLAVTSWLAFVSLSSLAVFSLWSSNVFASVRSLKEETSGQPHDQHRNTDSWRNGPPAQKFRENMREGTRYITSWPSAGWTNDVMAMANLIYLGLITERIPVMPPFTPSHVGGDVPPIAFGDVFDVERLRELLGKPVLEWRDLKDPESEEIEEIGCWNVWETCQEDERSPRQSWAPLHLGLDISYTKTPDWIAIGNRHTSFWHLARLAYPEARDASIVPPRPSPEYNVSLPPDEQMLCYDYLYYVATQQVYDFEKDYSAAWRFVGQHMHWNRTLQSLADSYIKAALGVDEDEPTPPYIAIHVRHNDFENWCQVPLDECFASIPVIARRVKEVQDELLRKGIEVTHVIMTSDERDPAWWSEVEQQGWFAVNHEDTAERYGRWYPVLIDAAIQSSGVGFVGTYASTMSMIAQRRTESWQDGAARIFRWGTLHADDH